MPIEAQTRLLRVLQEGEYTTVGGQSPISSNVRIIAATQRDLRTAVRQGMFREDLFYLLNVVPLRIPPLRERTEDIPLLLNYFSKKIAELNGISETKLDTAFDLYYQYDWPGNVRELRNLVERVSILSLNENKNNINHNVLNAKFHEKEADIIAQAGQPDAVTIATNMAGRGTDIVLGGNYEAEIKALDNSSSAKIDSLKKDWEQRHNNVCLLYTSPSPRD